jgi:hypothetical protein
VRAAKPILLAWLICGCHGPPIGEAIGEDGGTPGQGGGSGAGGTGGAGAGIGGTSAGAAGTGTGVGGTGAGVGGTGTGRGGAGGSGAANACARCETPCTDGVCDVAELRRGAGSTQLDAMAVALDGDRLYFAVGSGVEVRSIAKQGGGETTLYPNHDCTGCELVVAVDDADVFFVGQNIAGTNAVLAVPKGGGAVRTVCPTPSASPGQLTLEGPNVYWYRQDTGVERCPRAGGNSSPVASSSGIALRMASRPGGVVWANRDTGVVTRVDTGTLATRVLGVTANTEPTFAPGVCDVVDDGTLAYWVLCAWPHTVYAEGTGNTPAAVGRALSGTASGSFDQYGSIGVDGSYIYFTEAGLLNRVPKAGGSVEPRAWVTDATGNVFKGRIVGFDDRYVYLQRSGASLYRVVK